MKKQHKDMTLTYFGRGMLVFFTVLLALIILLYSVMWVLAKGPSETASRLFVRSVMETSAAKFLARIYFTEEEIAEIIDNGDIGDELTDPSLIEIPKDTKPPETSPVSPDENGDETTLETDGNGVGENDHTETSKDTEPEKDPTDDGIEIVDVQGSTYNGKMMIIADPSRVSVGTLPNYGAGYNGKSLRDFVADANALGGINAGGFEDEAGKGTGAVPDGIVIRDGKIIWGDAAKEYKCVMGFDKNNILHVGNMTGEKALSVGIVNGLNFEHGPVLIVNGVPANSKKSLGGGLNPRTAIGQRADGAILLLVINGRQADSLGATYNDLVNEMVRFGAVNAANLDGGSSTLMVYKGETLNQSAYFFGERKLPNVFLVGAGEANSGGEQQ